MSTDVDGEPFFDPITRLVVTLTALARPRDAVQWIETLSEFAEAVVRETLDREDELRALLDMPRKRSTGAAGAEQAPHGESNTTADASAAPTTLSVLPAAEQPVTAPSQEGADSATGGADAARRSRLNAQQREKLIEDYRAVRRGGRPVPAGWMQARANEFKVAYSDVYNATYPLKQELDKQRKESGKMLAALSPHPPRAERLKVRRVVGTYGGGG